LSGRAGRGCALPAGLLFFPGKNPKVSYGSKRWLKHCCLPGYMQLFFTVHGEKVAASMPFQKSYRQKGLCFKHTFEIFFSGQVKHF